MESWGCFGLKKDSQKQMPKIDFSKKGENTYFKTHNRLFFGYFFNRQPIWEALVNRIGRLQWLLVKHIQYSAPDHWRFRRRTDQV